MDNRKFQAAAIATPPAAEASPSVGYPTDGDPSGGVPATVPGAAWFHQIGEELRAVLTAASITPDHADLTQLFASIQTLYLIPSVQDFRLTLSNGVPVPTSDVTAATTLYFAPYKGNRIGLYDGTKWVLRSTAQLSKAIPAVANKVYDVFVYDDAGTPKLELLAWTDDTTRATGLVYQDGVLVKSGAVTRRYVGTIATTSAGTCEDSVRERYVWNMNNRVQRTGRVTDATSSWTYTTAAYRQANNNPANQIDFVRGLAEDAVFAEAIALITNTSANVPCQTGIGLDSGTATASGSILSAAAASNGSTAGITAFAIYNGLPSAGRHSLVWLENSNAVGTTTWYGGGIRGMTASMMM